MTWFILAVTFTLGVSAFCSLLEAMILSTTTAEIEGLKQRAPRKGHLLEYFKSDIEHTSSSILGLNTVANTSGASISGFLAAQHLGEGNVGLFSFFLTLAILVFSEVIPKNFGVLYRKSLQPHLVYPLLTVRIGMWPISILCKMLVQLIAGRSNTEEIVDEDIILMAEKSAKEGNLTAEESAMVSNALSLDEVRVSDVMTPRIVMTAYDKALTVGQLFAESRNISFARIPVYDEMIDNIVGIVRRRDLLGALAEDRDDATIEELMHEVIFVPENANGAHALQQFLQNHQQLAVVVDEFGSVSGVVTMEDIIEHILGQEIFEKDDVAIDMRELARRKRLASTRQKDEAATEAFAASSRQISQKATDAATRALRSREAASREERMLKEKEA